MVFYVTIKRDLGCNVFFRVSVQQCVKETALLDFFTNPAGYRVLGTTAFCSLLDPLSIFHITQLMNDSHKLLRTFKVQLNHDPCFMGYEYLGGIPYCPYFSEKILKPAEYCPPVCKNGCCTNQSCKRSENP